MRDDETQEKTKPLGEAMRSGSPEDVHEAARQKTASATERAADATRRMGERSAEVPGKMDEAKEGARESGTASAMQRLKERAQDTAKTAQELGREAKGQTESAKREARDTR